MLEFEQKQRYGMQQHANSNWHSGSGYNYGHAAPHMQMQPIPPPPPPQHHVPNMYNPSGYLNHNNGWSNPNHHQQMWPVNGGARPHGAKYSHYGGRMNVGGMVVEEVEEEECHYEARYEQSNWNDHNVGGGMGHHGPGGGHCRMGMGGGRPGASWVSKAL